MSPIEPPLHTESIGTFGGVEYLRHRGRFAGRTVHGRFAMPYEIVAPAEPRRESRTMVFEPPHFSSGPIARDVYLGADFLLGRGFVHASVGYSNFWMRALDPDPGFPLVLRGATVEPVFPWLPGEVVTDENVLRRFAGAVRRTRPAFLGTVRLIHAVGFSDSGDVVARVYREFGRRAFDLTFAGTAPYAEPVPGDGKLIVFNTEADFDERTATEPALPGRRCYAVAGAPHIPDTALTRLAFPPPASPAAPPAVAGTTPLDWTPIARALLAAGDAWVRDGTEPPPSAVLRLTRLGTVARDRLANPRGGIRHPALALGEARFHSSVVRGEGWTSFGAYGNVSSAVDVDMHRRLFARAAGALVRARFLLRADADALVAAAAAGPGTYTEGYMRGLVVPGAAPADEGAIVPLPHPLAVRRTEEPAAPA